MTKKTMVLGVSLNPDRASFQAVKKLSDLGIETHGIGIKNGYIGNVQIIEDRPVIDKVHTITLYLNSERQKDYYSYILSLHPRRLIFNPGAENEELKNLANAHGIQTEESCTLVLLSTGQY
jgi:uncharacterized protein